MPALVTFDITADGVAALEGADAAPPLVLPDRVELRAAEFTSKSRAALADTVELLAGLLAAPNVPSRDITGTLIVATTRLREAVAALRFTE
jgi:hypothetical protein